MPSPIRVNLPNNWQPRPDQMDLWAYLERGGLRADECAHRRWGKDDVSLHWAAIAAHKRVGTYWHMLPEASQARKAIWDAINPRTGKRRIDEAFPRELRQTTREQDMFIRFKNGSTWQVVGSDNYNSLVGSPPTGVVFSEWSLAMPHAWSYLRPILLENGGWAVFIWTPRGRNHATRAFEAREKDHNWFTQRMPATLTPVFTAAQLEQEKKELIAETGSVAEGTAKYESEYMVNFDAPVPGSYFGEEIAKLVANKQVTYVPYDPRFPVSTSWDLGIDDYTAIWFWQRIHPRRVNAIGFYETGDVGLDTIVKEAFVPRGNWKFDFHYLPHDVAVRELGAGGRSRRQTLNGLGIRPIRTGIKRDPDERINASRRLFPFVWFDEKSCEAGIDHLKQYRKRWNVSMNIFTGPLHNEDSHAADSFGEFAVNAKLPQNLEKPKVVNPIDSYRPQRSMLEPAMNWKTM